MADKNEPKEEEIKDDSLESDVTNGQETTANVSENEPNPDKVSDDEESSAEESSANDEVADDSEAEEQVDYEAKYNELNDTYLRLRAEFDNYRKRTIREKAELIKSGGEAALVNLLPVIDDFERALSTIKNTEDAKAVVDGVELIYNKFASYLSQQGVKPMEAIGQVFDTESFEAIATIPAPDKEMKGKVIDCVQTGYMLYDKVLRHAKVVVGE